MGLGLGYALSGLGQGLEQGIGQYLAQKRLETEQARQARIDAETAALHQATVQHYQAMDSAEGGRVAAALAAHGIVPSDTPDVSTPSVADALSAPGGPSMGGLPDVGAPPPAPVYSIGGQSYQYDPTRDPTQVRVKTVADEIAARQKLHDTPSGTAVYGRTHPAPSRQHAPAPPVADDPKHAAFLLKRVVELTKTTPGLGGLPKPGLSLDAAKAQAETEWSAAHGGGVPAAPAPAVAHPASAAVPQSAYDAAAAKYQHALSLGIDPAQAREAYNQTVMQIAQQGGAQ